MNILMVEILILGVIFFISISALLWQLGKFEWLDKICTALVVSLPFERIPSLEIGGSNIRVSQIIVIIGLWLFVILFFKKDEQTCAIKLHPINVLLLLFIIFAIPSSFFVIDTKRFAVTLAATYLCFGAVFLLSNFAKNIEHKLKLLFYTFILVGLFGLYQFFGDLIGLPIYLTGLREQYTKIILGISRVQATAIEPLYFAGMLFLPLIYLVFNILTKTRLDLFKSWKIDVKTLLLLFFTTIFILTLSKAAFVIISGVLILIFIFSYSRLNIQPLIKSIIKILVASATLLSLGILFFKNFEILITNLVANFFATITFQFASSIERLNFLQAALVLLPSNIVLGIGSGQYGAWIKSTKLIPFQDPASYLIVNNVYLEVWLEFGLLAVLVFLGILFWPVWRNIKILRQDSNWRTTGNIARLTLVFTLISLYIQWLTFSPIFIMPIFILIGLLAGLTKNDDIV